jgi:AcrR family transcriptional regulator
MASLVGDPAATATLEDGAEQPGAADGRVARGERTRRALAEALIALLEEGDPQPTAKRVAERAGVSLRLVFHHFDDMEQVLRAAVAVQVARHWRHVGHVDPAAPLADRIERTVRQHTALFERIAPVRRAAALVEARSAVVGAELAHGRERLRHGLEETFASELALAPAPRAELLDLLEVATSFETWDQLRRRTGHGAGATRDLMARLMGAALARPDRGGTT